MSSILLGSLAYQGLNNSNKSISKNKLNSVYNSDMENTMNKIEHRQINQNFSKSEYLNQFDDLKFDNTNIPTGINETMQKKNGINTSLQRNLDFQRGYSEFQNVDMHYDIVPKEQFTHNNMTPYTSKRDFSNNSDRVQRKLETFTGISSN